MKLMNVLFSFALLISVSPLARAAAADPVARVAEGEIRGRLLPGGGAAFKGIPFAQPPVGNLRWHDPVPVKPWTGVRDTGAFAPPCVQPSSNEPDGYAGAGSEEDCLYLNVWTPEWSPKSPKPVPVMVWLYGGTNITGAGSYKRYDGTALSRRGVIVVTINYRLGVFGFFAHPGLTAESPHHSSGNYGLLDQLAALKWVHDNIAKLGGDPREVTLFGQSSGAIDTSILVASPLSKGLIDRAIQESGPPARPMDSLAIDEQAGIKFTESLQAPSGDAAVKYLRSLPAAVIQKAAETGLKGAMGNYAGILLRPLIDGYVIPKYPVLSYKDAQDLPIPMIIGNNAREMQRNYDPATLRKWVEDNWGPHAAEADKFYGLANGGAGSDDPLFGTANMQIMADDRDRCPALAQSIWRTASGHSTYSYMWDVPVAGEAYTRHGAEVPYVFGNFPDNGNLSGSYTEAGKKIRAADIQAYWVNFAKTGNPNGNGLPAWPEFNAATRLYLEFTVHDEPAVHRDLRRDICDMYIDALKVTIPANTAADWPE